MMIARVKDGQTWFRGLDNLNRLDGVNRDESILNGEATIRILDDCGLLHEVYWAEDA